jgi:hypothetical protein
MLKPVVFDVFEPDVQATHFFMTRTFFTPCVVECFGRSRWWCGLLNSFCCIGLWRWWFGSRQGFRLLEIGDLIADESQMIAREPAIGVRRQYI